jgi:predicted O-methyltransferase YrrM
MAPAHISEPDSPDAIAAWISQQTRAHDRFAHVYDASERHRQEHGPECTVYPTGSGPVLGTLAAATGAKRILEVGCGLGYSALWLAYGSSPGGRVESIERDVGHAELARQQLGQEEYADRITVHLGSGAELLPRLIGPYDFVFCDSDLEEYGVYLEHFVRLLQPGGLLITSNLFLGCYSVDIPGLDQATAYRLKILDDRRLFTAFLAGGMALSVRQRD